MTTKRLAKGVTGAVGGAAAGTALGFMGGAMGGVQFGIPLGILFGLINLATGGGFAGFLGVLISTCFLLGLGGGIFTALFYGIGGAAAGSTWGKDDK